MTTLAGFLPLDPNDKYYVPRTAIGLPGNLSPEDLAGVLFEDLGRWKDEVASEQGDKSPAAKEFLSQVLPYMSEIIAQDGVLWKKYHVNNPSFKEVQNRLDGRTGAVNYSAWCEQKLLEIKQDVQQCNLKRKRREDLQTQMIEEVQKMRGWNQKLEDQFNLMVSSKISCMYST